MSNESSTDRNNSRNKVKFILAWYYVERKKLNDAQKLMLLNKWIKSCTQFEEYEMSNALLNEKRILVRHIRLKKVGVRSFFKEMVLRTRVVIRSIKRGFK